MQKKIESTLPRNLHAVSESISISLHSTPQDWAKSLSDTGFNSIDVSSDALIAKKFQSYDFSGKPHHFTQLEFSKNSLKITYSQADNQNPVQRKLGATHLALLALSTIGGASLSPELSAYLSTLLDDCNRVISPSQAELEHKNIQLKHSVSQLNEKLSALYSQREKDSKRALDDAKKISILQAQVQDFSEIPDSMLDELVLNWLTTHGGEINMTDFCAQHNAPASRVEGSLDRLSKASRIRRV